jgi:hypothetical protein
MTLTLEMIRGAVRMCREHEIKPFDDGTYEMRIHPSRAQQAFELGLQPYSSLIGYVPKVSRVVCDIDSSDG